MTTLLHAAQHHAKDKTDLIREISFAFTTLLRPAGWDVRTIRGGASSWVIYKGSREFHFRDGGTGAISVKDRYYNGSVVVTLRTRMDVWNWAKKL